MCGLVGIIANSSNGFNAMEMDIFRDMLVVDSIRGEDSTGIFSVNRYGNANSLKLATHPYNLVKSKDYEEWRGKSFTDGRAVIGHNRKATVGAVNNDNAHPFLFGPVMLVHNGSISNYRSLLSMADRDKHKIEVDSHAAAVMLARNEPEKILPEFRGAYAMIWYNTNTKRLYFIRNDERPLALARVNNNIFFASEDDMLKWLLGRRYNFKETPTIQYLKPGTLLSAEISDKELVWDKQEIEEKKSSVVVLPNRPHSEAANDRKARTSKDEIIIPEDQKWRIHYGYDELVDEDIEHLQIVWEIEDFKPLNNQKGPPIYMAWGRGLESNYIEVSCNFQGITEKEVEALGYAGPLKSYVRRVKKEMVENGDEKRMVQKVSVIGSMTEPFEVVETCGGGGVKIGKAHLEHLWKHSGFKCYCGMLVKDMLFDDVVQACWYSKGNYVKADGLKYYEVELDSPICDACMKGDQQVEAHEASQNPPL